MHKNSVMEYFVSQFSEEKTLDSWKNRKKMHLDEISILRYAFREMNNEPHIVLNNMYEYYYNQDLQKVCMKNIQDEDQS